MRVAIQSWRRAGISLATGITLALGAVPAEAARFLVVYTGTVDQGSVDETGVFGGSPLDGSTFRAEFVVDDSAYGATSIFGPDFSQLYGGANQGAGFVVPVTATLTINGISRQFGTVIGTDGGAQYSDNPFEPAPDDASPMDSMWHTTGDKGVHGGVLVRYGLSLGFDAVNLLGSGDYRVPTTYTLGSFGEGFGSFSYSEEALDAGLLPTGIYTVNANGSLIPDSVQVSALAAVPEPASWAMMIAGFGFVGGALRSQSGRRRSAQQQRVLV